MKGVYERHSGTNFENSFLVYKGVSGVKFCYHCKLCGDDKIYSRKYSPTEYPLSCGCSKKILPKKDYTGVTINGIYIKGYIGDSKWRVVSSCGCEEDCKMPKVIQRTQSKCEKCRDNKNVVHGHARKHKGGQTREYNSWCNLRRRCSDTKNNRYQHYGDSGISFCKDWENFEVFLEDMGTCPKGYSIERLRVDEGYSKDNCVWVNDKTQANNKTNNILISNGIEVMSLKHWCDIISVDYKQAHYRFKYKKMCVEEILGKGYRLAKDKFDI